MPGRKRTVGSRLKKHHHESRMHTAEDVQTITTYLWHSYEGWIATVLGKLLGLNTYSDCGTTGGVRNRQDIPAAMRPAFFDDEGEPAELFSSASAGHQKGGGMTLFKFYRT